MEKANTLVDLGTSIKTRKDLSVIFTKNNCPMCQMLFIRVGSMEDEGEIETPIMIHNIEEDDYEKASELYELSSTPTMVRFKDGKEIGRASSIGLTPDKFEELDTGDIE